MVKQTLELTANITKERTIIGIFDNDTEGFNQFNGLNSIFSEQVKKEHTETVCSAERLEKVLKAIRGAHPYEESSTDVYLLEDF